jgi:hypothetical protein
MHVVHGTLSSLRPATKFGRGRYPRLQEPEEVEVEVRRLDRVLDETFDGLDGRRPFLKLDTQGFDLDVFAGAGDSIERFVGLQSELALMEIYKGMPRMQESLAAYEKAGFEIAGLYPVSRQTRTARVLEYDCVMVRASVLKVRAEEAQEGELAPQTFGHFLPPHAWHATGAPSVFLSVTTSFLSASSGLMPQFLTIARPWGPPLPM